MSCVSQAFPVTNKSYNLTPPREVLVRRGTQGRRRRSTSTIRFSTFKMVGNMRNWRPTASPEAIHLRSEIVWRIRSFFHQLGFDEVHTPSLSRDTVVDRFIEPVVVPASSLQSPAALDVHQWFLQTSPEFCMKRLLASGVPTMYQICSVFRAGEVGAWHNTEFTMVEWYRVGDCLEQGVQLLSELVAAAIGCSAAEVLTYQNVFERYVGIDPLAASNSTLAETAGRLISGIEMDWTDDRDGWLELLFSDCIQPKLGHGRPTIVTHYPAAQSALARLASDDPRVAERFELFIEGVELANGYAELTNASELDARNTVVNKQRTSDGQTALPPESSVIEAMQAGMPECSGCALGLDRLVAVAGGFKSVADVICFPADRA